jgi:hypothetical protein
VRLGAYTKEAVRTAVVVTLQDEGRIDDSEEHLGLDATLLVDECF